MKSKVNSECPPSWSLTCFLFRVTTVNTLEHILPDFFPKTHSYLHIWLLLFFFSKLRSHKASSPGTCWLPFFHERICHKLSICSCLSGGTWMESLVFLMSPWVVSGPFNFFVEWDVSWEKSSVLLTISREGNATIPWKLFLVLYSLSHQKNLPDVDPVFFLVTEDPPCFLFSLHAY